MTAPAVAGAGSSERRGTEGLAVHWLGCVPYGEALARQEQAVDERRSGKIGDQLLLLEHPPVITLGSAARDENVRITPAECRARGIDTFRVRRGGDVTYHAPGQLVGYLVVDLAQAAKPDVHRFLREIEAALMDVIAAFGLSARRIAGMTGVFMDERSGGANSPERKIASIGVGLRGWVTYHGFALNVDVDLEGFDTIVPCGLQGVEMTSLAHELGRSPYPGALVPDAESVRDRVAETFRRRFGNTG